ncbi:site-specific DNA-methyltransferase [Bremerella cremea]|uniref:Site-specific DNA-methyltransferase n=2 Tax=Bremerella cremea TaxID=1031537 RepID=A0A368KTS1_9BACT|nr:site-specific DNA-methyltransferase [Bremerella cremea]
MNQKRDEVVRFLEKDLLPQVKEAFSHYQSADKATLQKELDKLVTQIEGAGMNPDESPKVQEIKQQMADSSVDVTALENEVFSHLFNFFRRYYHEGDFISLRRYKEGVYAIPYEGEEVKLHWANHDQYYVKSSEYFRDYIFTMPSGKRVRVHLVAASSEQDNKKEQAGKERRFVICKEDPIYEEAGELYIRFEYRPETGQKKQDALNQEAIEKVLNSEGFDDWVRELSKPAPTKSNPNRTVLEKHLTQYTARNTFDYFIHKDLGGFLRRELDFYIKNEVMHLDDIEHDTVPRVEQYLSKIKVIRKIAHKIIQFLEQLENFQKKLWLKKKFVVETNYCITLDRIPEELYPDIAANDAQREEWVRLFAIDEIEKDLNQPGYSEPLSVEFLKSFSHLPIDTLYFSRTFRDSLLSSLDGLDEGSTGLLVNSENFQAVNLLHTSMKGKVTSMYLDPPYNTDAGPISYKNGFRNSSWIALFDSRLQLAQSLLTASGITCVTIDDFESHNLRHLLDLTFSEENLLGVVPIKNNPAGRTGTVGFSLCHEYAFFYGASEESRVNRLEHSEKQKARYKEEDEEGRFEWTNFRKHGGVNTYRTARPRQYYPIYVSGETIRIPELEWDNVKRTYTINEEPSPDEEVLWPIDSQGRERIWDFNIQTAKANIPHLAVRKDSQGNTAVYRKWRLNSEGLLPQTWWDKSEYSAAEYGTNLLSRMFGETHSFMFPKSLHAVTDCLRVSGLRNAKDGIGLDYFAGSGTTGHAVISLNREDGGSRSFVLVEVGKYFHSVLVARMKKAAYCAEWRKGKPTTHDEGLSQCFKYIALESYEDALANLEMKRTSQQATLLEQDDDMREQYVLSYMLDVETRGSQSLLNVDSFRTPDEYKLRVERDGETKLVNVDLVETFNWLLGLTVMHIDVIRGVRVVEGTNPDGDRTLVLWRNLDEIDNEALDEWFQKQKYNTKDQEYDLIYVNGDNNLENLRRGDQTWKVRLIEEEFGRLMFDVQDI